MKAELIDVIKPQPSKQVVVTLSIPEAAMLYEILRNIPDASELDPEDSSIEAEMNRLADRDHTLYNSIVRHRDSLWSALHDLHLREITSAE